MQCEFPPVGKYPVLITSIEKGFSNVRKTPQITVWFSDGISEFNDNLYVTEKAIPRLALFAKRVCLMDEKTQLPDEDKECKLVIARYIMENSVGKKCVVTIEENEETYIPTSGPDIGVPKKIKKRRVAFRGYDRYIENEPGQNINEPKLQSNNNNDDLPF